MNQETEKTKDQYIIIVRQPSSSSYFKLISCGDTHIEIAKEKVLNQFQFWHISKVRIFGYIICSDSTITKELILTKFRRRVIPNEWINVTQQELFRHLKKIQSKHEIKEFVENKRLEAKKVVIVAEEAKQLQEAVDAALEAPENTEEE